MIYVSSRNIPLLAQERGKVPIVTMENYGKWYGVDIIHPDGRVEGVDPDLLSDLERESGTCLMGDHNYHPQLLERVAVHYKGKVDWRAAQMAGGRWTYEIEDGHMTQGPQFFIPRNKEL